MVVWLRILELVYEFFHGLIVEFFFHQNGHRKPMAFVDPKGSCCTRIINYRSQKNPFKFNLFRNKTMHKNMFLCMLGNLKLMFWLSHENKIPS